MSALDFRQLGAGTNGVPCVAFEVLTRARMLPLQAMVLLVVSQAAAGQQSVPKAQTVAQPTVACESKPGERAECAADTSKGIMLLRSTGDAPCLLGKTWG